MPCADPCVLLGSVMLAPPGLTDTGVEGVAEAFTETPGLYPVYLEKAGNDTWIAEIGKGRKTFITVKAGSTSPKKYIQQLRGIYNDPHID